MEVLLMLAVPTALCGLGAVLALRQIVRVRRTPTSPIARVREGRAEVVGRASGAALESPISRRPCVLWRVHVQEQSREGWTTVLDTFSLDPFRIRDDTGTIRIDPSGARLFLGDHSGWIETASPETAEFLRRFGVDMADSSGRRTFRVAEQVLEVGAQIYALGWVLEIAGEWAMGSMGEHPFVLSNRSEKAALRSLYARLAMCVAGLLGLLVAVYGILDSMLRL